MKLTIGMATYEDYSGVFFTVQALRLYQDCADVEVLVVDNAGCDLTMSFCRKAGVKYHRFTEVQGTAAPRDQVFALASGTHVLCLDSHVLLAPGSVARLKHFYEEHPDSLDLYQGPLHLVSPSDRVAATELDDTWRGGMWGRWVNRHVDETAGPFEIRAQGLGLFSCRKDAWPGFHPRARGHGGEEGYIHEKFRLTGRKCWCLPWLKWAHRFGAPPAYPAGVEDKFRNYLLGFVELGRDPRPMLDHFRTLLPEDRFLQVATETLRGLSLPTPLTLPGPPPARKSRPPRAVLSGPKVSCVMCTYGRAHLAHRPLDEAVESFLRQTYADRELLIYNDTPGQQLRFDHPLVRVVNLPFQVGSYGRKVNDAVRMTGGEVVAVWDDDDIHLPHRLELLVEELKDYECVMPRRTWHQQGSSPITPGACGFHFGVYARESFEATGGYPDDSDVEADQRLAARLHRRVVDLNPDRFVSVYRWTREHPHFSWYPKGDHNYAAGVRYDQGCFDIRPAWLRDYPRLAAEAAGRGEPAPRPS